MISIFNTRNLCYLSSEFFLDKIEESLEALDIDVSRINLPELSSNPDISKLSDLEVGDVVIDINSTLPRIKTENGDFWLDKTGAKFFNYILDHPLYHHTGLSAKLKNYHVICLSQSHKDYILENYPHIKSVEIMSIPGSSPLSILPYKDREDSLLFQGSYIPMDNISSELKTLKETYGSTYSRILGDIMDSWDPFYGTLEDTVKTYLKEESIDIKSLDFCGSFPELLNLLFPADRIKRNILREDLLFRLSEEVPLVIMGQGWEKSRLNSGRHRNLPSENYALSLQKNGKYKFLLDINPFFLDGIHDRVSNGFAAGCLVFSNMNSKDLEAPKPEKEYISYPEDDITKIVNSINNYNPDLEYISAKGMSYWMDRLTWRKWAENFLKLLG